MMKRTATLSALIAVALSGTVMAPELVISYDNNEYTATGSVSVQGATADAVYTALSGADMAGEMKTYASKKPNGIIAGVGLEGGTYTSGPVKAIGQFVGEYSGNTLTVTSGSYVGEFRFSGAATYNGNINSNANNNMVTVSGVTMQKNGSKYPEIASGWAWNDANENTINITSSSLNDALVYGGCSQDKGSAIGNSVVITNDAFTNANYGIVGGITENEGSFAQGNEGDSLSNSVTINGGTINAKVYGGYSIEGIANENTVNITGGAVSSAIYGGYGLLETNNNIVNISDAAVGKVFGGRSQGDAIGNTVNILNSTTTNIYGGVAPKGTTTSDANQNKVTVENSTVNANVYGGVIDNDLDVDGDTNYNEVVIKNSSVATHVHAGSNAMDGNSHYNKLTITDSTVGQWVTAGQSSYGDANYNEIVIDGTNGSVIGSNVYGGRAQADGSETYNTVSITNATIEGPVHGGAAIDTYMKD